MVLILNFFMEMFLIIYGFFEKNFVFLKTNWRFLMVLLCKNTTTIAILGVVLKTDFLKITAIHKMDQFRNFPQYCIKVFFRQEILPFPARKW